MRTDIKFRRLRAALAALAACFVLGVAMPSCGSIHAFGGIEHECVYDFDGHGHYKKHKKHKHKKHKKHHRHHHH